MQHDEYGPQTSHKEANDHQFPRTQHWSPLARGNGENFPRRSDPGLLDRLESQPRVDTECHITSLWDNDLSKLTTNAQAEQPPASGSGFAWMALPSAQAPSFR